MFKCNTNKNTRKKKSNCFPRFWKARDNLEATNFSPRPTKAALGTHGLCRPLRRGEGGGGSWICVLGSCYIWLSSCSSLVKSRHRRRWKQWFLHFFHVDGLPRRGVDESRDGVDRRAFGPAWLAFSTTTEPIEGDDVPSCFCSPFPCSSDEAQSHTVGELVRLCPLPDWLELWLSFGPSRQQLLLETTLCLDHGRRHLLVYIDDFLVVASASSWVPTKLLW